MLVVFPVGFDEKFIVRALMRKRDGFNGLEKGDKLLAILPKGYQNEKKTLNAVESIENIATPLVGEGNVIRLEVPLEGEEMVLTIKEGIERNITRDRIVLAVLSGGMRPLIVGTMLALLWVKDAKVLIESDFENLSGHISLELSPFLAPHSRRWKLILCGLSAGKSVRTIAKELEVSPATLSSELKKLGRYYLVEAEKPDGRAPKYRITNAGCLYLKLMGDECNET